ncbi:Gfo/Idh/MocA family protein [Paenibacillus sp. JCM 10914]|uniref:Gfo/Idh/MocA family protein n=1 Tax=Paenibacillus sp. JCM 10914 TaxID=1236974 RepID=UPI0003CC7A00|nr:Gfo/Idh/MocA family oxidoreductase [Paenibacillus sp. JCM 10914]GAE07192.1 oxidoreductase, putative [Paenibacillus sp. JCM 10914]
MTIRKFGIIGCQHAHIGLFIEEMLALGYECTGIYEPDNMKLARAMADQYGLRILSDVKLLLSDEEVSVIGCASINNKKIDVIELCETHGKHIMVDKPAVTNREGLERLRAVLERGAIEIGMMLTERFRPSLHTVRRLIEAGGLGDIVHISLRKPHRLNPQSRPAWHFDKQQSGGIINDLFVHDFDLLRWLTGREVECASGYLAKNILPQHPSFYDTGGARWLWQTVSRPSSMQTGTPPQAAGLGGTDESSLRAQQGWSKFVWKGIPCWNKTRWPCL